MYTHGFNSKKYGIKTSLSVNGKPKHTHLFKSWLHALERSYSEKWHLKYPTYSECSVSVDWFDFQEYGKHWLDSDFYNEGWHLDKDLLFKGNKVYSKDTCVFLPPSVNKFLTKNNVNRGSLPIGVHFSSRNKKYAADCGDLDGKKIWLGYHNSPDKAFLAYKNCKEELARMLAERWKSDIDPRAILALNNYEVSIHD